MMQASDNRKPASAKRPPRRANRSAAAGKRRSKSADRSLHTHAVYAVVGG